MSNNLQISHPNPQVQKPRFDGFDFLRATFAIVVVALHANLFNLFLNKPRVHFISDILNLNVGYLAVPVFLQISLFLFYVKSEKTGQEYFWKKRLPKLLSLYFFWSVSKLLFDLLLLEKESTQASLQIDSFWDVILLKASAGYTVFYFFFDLLILSALTEILINFYRKVKSDSVRRRITYYLLTISCGIVVALPIIDLVYQQEVLTQVIDPLSFLPYVFTTAIVVQELHAGELKTLTPTYRIRILGLLALFLGLATFEWVLFSQFPHSRLFPHYCRLSLVVASWLLLYLAIFSRQKVPAIIALLSACSLGIYGFHTFFTDHTELLGIISGIVPGPASLTIFFVALAGSIMLTLLFQKIKPLRQFV